MDLLKKVSEIFDIPEEELEKQIASGLMLAATAGLAIAGKKGKELLKNKLAKVSSDEKLSDSFNVLLASFEMMLEKHRKLKNMENTTKPLNVRVVECKKPPLPPRIPPKPKPKREEGESRDKC